MSPLIPVQQVPVAAATLHERRPRPAQPLLARAICQFASGEAKCLFATQISLGGACILSLQPPPLGEELLVTLYPRGLPSLPPIRSRVIACRIDSANALRSGFEVVFMELDDQVLSALQRRLAAIESMIEPPPSPARPRGAVERRRNPRVPGDLHVILSVGARQVPLTIVDLSMSGALLALNGRAWPPELQLDQRIELSIIDPTAPESVTLRAKVVRKTSPPERPGFGVCFVDVEQVDALRLESLILDLIVSHGA